MRILATGGAGFIGRWVVARLLAEGHEVLAFDNLSSGALENIREWENERRLSFRLGDIRETGAVTDAFAASRPDICFHLAASINVQDSLDNPGETFANDVAGTFNVLEACRRHGAKMVFMSTCMVYDRCHDEAISEAHPVKPASPYAGAKLAGEHLALSYYHGYGLPVVVLRPFNTYGPFQKATGEGGVISIFLSRALRGDPLLIYGDGTQTRDFLYVEDCAEFVVRAGLSEQAVGRVLNAGTGRDVSINELAEKVLAATAGLPGTATSEGATGVRHVPHIHPQSEIPRLRCDWRLARELLGWEPQVSLEEGLVRTAGWIKK